MLIISLLAHIQFCVERYKTRKALYSLTAQQMADAGITLEVRQTELSKATLLNVTRELMTPPLHDGGEP